MPSFESHNSFTANGGLATVNLADLDYEDTTCSICLNSYHCAPDFDDPKRLPCGHVLGEVCILTWTQASNTCPMCRSELFTLETEIANRDDEGSRGYGGVDLYAVEPVSLDLGFWNDEDDWEGAWLRSLGVDSAYVPLGSEGDPLGPVSVFRPETEVPSLDLSLSVSDPLLDQVEQHGDDINQSFLEPDINAYSMNLFTPTIATQLLIVEELDVEYDTEQEIEELDGGMKELVGRQEEWMGELEDEDNNEEH
jgi:hypothetical protein